MCSPKVCVVRIKRETTASGICKHLGIIGEKESKWYGRKSKAYKAT